ncbi:hypothetical protein A2U01_0052736, partial [Trifolium medium]|nr:hypothetical protein [Trifolium medium]
ARKLSPKTSKCEKSRNCTLAPDHGRAWLPTTVPGFTETIWHALKPCHDRARPC